MRQGTVATEPVKVDVGSVEGELANLWVRAAEGGIPGVAAPVTRVLLSNLLVYAASDAEADEAKDIIVEIAADHPSRAVIADAQPGEPGRELKADVSMLCNITERGRRLCGEEIRIHVHGLTAAAPGTILPVLAPDLPVYLWTPGEFAPDDDILRQLAHVADHWIIDSRRFANWIDRLRLAVAIGPRHEPQLVLHDLAWIATAQWRELVAQHFDPLPAREYLRRISRVEIAYKPSERTGPPVEPMLMAAWLMRQLGWQSPKIYRGSDGILLIVAASDEREVSIRLRPEAKAVLPIDEVVIECGPDDRRGVFRTARADHPDEVYLEADAPGVPAIRRTVQMAESTRSSELRQALDAPGRDVLYERTLSVLEGLMQEIESKA